MKKKFYEVSTPALLAIGGSLWLIAGFNVAKLGIEAYRGLDTKQWYLVGASVVIFILFGTMFYKISGKHKERIETYKEDHKPFWYFFDVKSYLIMAFMMSGGIYLRSSGVVSDCFIAYFYSGLGLGLAVAGIMFWKNYFLLRKKK